MLQHKLGYLKGPLMATGGCVGLWSVRQCCLQNVNVWMDFGSCETFGEASTVNLTCLFLLYNFLVSTGFCPGR